MYPNSHKSDGVISTRYFMWAVFPTMEDWSPIDRIGFEMLGNFSGSKKLRSKTSITFSDPRILSLKEVIIQVNSGL